MHGLPLHAVALSLSHRMANVTATAFTHSYACVRLQLRGKLQKVIEESSEILKALVCRHDECVEAADQLTLLFAPSGYAEVIRDVCVDRISH